MPERYEAIFPTSWVGKGSKSESKENDKVLVFIGLNLCPGLTTRKLSCSWREKDAGSPGLQEVSV